MATFKLFNEFASMWSECRYLEIGVHAGETFLNVNAPQEIAVDPAFAFDFSKYIASETAFFEINSDKFFEEVSVSAGPFDVCFVDGLHTFDQTFRDFCTCLLSLSPNGVIIKLAI